jgi:hypothetical protein
MLTFEGVNMKHLNVIFTILVIFVASMAFATPGPVQEFNDENLVLLEEFITHGNRDFGDPGDFISAMNAGADYLVYMQADVTEDNAGNGDPDLDPEDGGWDWATANFEHSEASSPGNITGAVAQGLYQTYLFNPDPSYFIAMTDAAVKSVERFPDVRSASDMTFLMNYAALAGVADPDYFIDGAEAIWQYRLANYGGTPTAFAEYIRDLRAGQGYANGIIPWDVALYCTALVKLDSVRSGLGYDQDAIDVAEVIWQDSFNASPGYFDPDGHSMGFDEGWANTDYYWYSLGVSGLIDAFSITETHTDEILGLTSLMLDCQFENGAFSFQYGASFADDWDWQSAAYCVLTMGENLAELSDEINNACYWIASEQDVSGGWLYSSGNHYPEIGGECTAALAYGVFVVPVMISNFDSINELEGLRLNWSAIGSLTSFHIDKFNPENQSWIRLTTELISANDSSNYASYSFVDNTVYSGNDYRYRLSGSTEYGDEVEYGSLTVSYNRPVYALLSKPVCSPNPFNPATSIKFTLGQPENVSLEVIDISGRVVRHLLDNVSMSPGVKEFVFNGCDDNSQSLASGIYFTRLTAGMNVQMSKMTLIK